MRRATYLLPIKSASLDGFEELTAYLRSLQRVNLIVVDGSEQRIFAEHARAWAALGTHIPPDPQIGGLNGKARGVLTGIAASADEYVIIADDDVRYDAAALDAVIAALRFADVVRPQNYFAPHRWHTVLDSGRSLLNRISGGDWPGTLGLRRSSLSDGYNGDVLFENFELVQTVKANGGSEQVAYGTFVARRPPSTQHFFAQRVRQAYDEFARPARLAAALSVLPLAALAIARRRAHFLTAGALVVIAAAEVGRRRAGGARYFPAVASLAAPVWVLERGVCAWLAVAMRAWRGGMPYAGSVVRNAATPALKRRGRAA